MAAVAVAGGTDFFVENNRQFVTLQQRIRDVRGHRGGRYWVDRHAEIDGAVRGDRVPFMVDNIIDGYLIAMAFEQGCDGGQIDRAIVVGGVSIER